MKNVEDILFPKSQSVGERDWGSEDLLVLIPIQFLKSSNNGIFSPYLIS